MAIFASEYRDEALKILGRVPLVDGHNDFAMFIRGFYGNQLDSRFNEQDELEGHVDIKRLRAGGCGAVYWSAYMSCPEPENDFSDAVFLPTLRDTLQQIDLIHRLIERFDAHLELVHTSADIERIFKAGKIASMIGVEGLHQIANSAAVLRNYHRLGVRYITLTHNSHNLYADCAKAAPLHNGLSDEGRRMVKEMNRIGMMVDLAHVSEGVMSDVLDISEAPVAFTHSSCFAVTAHSRNPSDAALDKLKKNNGIIMISFVASFTNSDPEAATVYDVVDHIMHAADRIGFDHIGVGSDFDGTSKLIEGLEDVSQFPNLVACLLERGVAAADIEKILGWNAIRVLRDVEATAARLKNTPALEDKVHDVWNEEERRIQNQKHPKWKAGSQ